MSFVTQRAEHFPKSSANPASKLYQQQQLLASQIVACLTSSKTETRAAAEALLRKCVHFGVLSMKNVHKGKEKLLPAQQRTVSSIVQSLESTLDEASNEREQKVQRTPKKVDESSSRKTRVRSQSREQGRPSDIGGEHSRTMRPSLAKTQSSRRFTYTSTKNLGVTESPSNDDSWENGTNPLNLKPSASSTKDDRSSAASRKRENWPEHPEEPSGTEHLHSLKKTWSHLLQAPSIDRLFPSKGLLKQEDALPGVALIEQAIDISADDLEDSSVIEQLDLIFKWLVCAICSREHTAGLQAILKLLLKLFEFLIKREYQMTDFEGSLLLPHLLEKTSIAKVSRSVLLYHCFAFAQLRTL